MVHSGFQVFQWALSNCSEFYRSVLIQSPHELWKSGSNKHMFRKEKMNVYKIIEIKMFDSSAPTSVQNTPMKNFFDSSSQSSGSNSPKLTVRKSPTRRRSKINYKIFFSSKQFTIAMLIVSFIPLILYQNENPSLFCKDGLQYFCK